MDRVILFAGFILLFADQCFAEHPQTANGWTIVNLNCLGSSLYRIDPSRVSCSAADGSSPETADAVKLAAVRDMCLGRQYCTVDVASLGGTTCSSTRPHTLISFRCYLALTANGLNSVDLTCIDTDDMIDPWIVTCSAADGSSLLETVDAVRLAAVRDMCLGKQSCTVDVASLGGTACSSTRPHTLIYFRCHISVSTDGATIVQMICGTNLMIEPLEVRCIAPGGENPTAADPAKMLKLKAELGRVNRYTVTVASLGNPACVAPTPNTDITYKCVTAPAGLECYHCSSSDASSSCGNVIESADPKAVIRFGCTTCQKTVMNAVVTRSCMLAQCSIASRFNTNIHCCDTDLCNNSSTASRDDHCSLLVMLLAVITANSLHM